MRALVTTCCTLEPLVAGHAQEMFRVLGDPAIYEFENEPPPSEEWLQRRYRMLEQRWSTDGQEQWLNWVIRLPDGALAGHVQATVLPSATALVAYELNSRYWRQGIGRSAVTAMLQELRTGYDVAVFSAVLKATNFRSLGLLRSLGFQAASEQQVVQFGATTDELVMVRTGSTQ